MALIPKFSIRQMLLGMVAMAIVSACVAGAVRGNPVAFGMSVAMAGLVVPAMLATVGYWLAFGMAKLVWSRRD